MHKKHIQVMVLMQNLQKISVLFSWLLDEMTGSKENVTLLKLQLAQSESIVQQQKDIYDEHATALKVITCMTWCNLLLLPEQGTDVVNLKMLIDIVHANTDTYDCMYCQAPNNGNLCTLASNTFYTADTSIITLLKYT